jgi:nucleoside-diphosphate-sugar epimerase
LKILVTGATGFTGERVLPMLVGKGEIRCFVRPSSNIQEVKGFGHEIVYGDLSDIGSLKTAMLKCDALINIASLGFGHGPGIVKAAEEARIRRAIFISTTALFTELNAKSKSVRQQAEDCIKASKLDWTILRPTMIYGAPGDRNMIRLIRFIDHSPVIPIFGSGDYLQQPVYVENVAKSIVAVLFTEKTIKNEFNISGKYPHTFSEIIDLTAQALGKRIIRVHIPSKISLYATKLYEKLSKRPLIKSEQIMRLNENKNFDYSAAKEAFGYDPISFEEGIAKEVALYRQLKNKDRG